MDSTDTSLTVLLNRWGKGDSTVESELMDRIYPLIYQSARRQLIQEPIHHTLQTTELVNEVFIRLCKKKSMDFDSHIQFKAFAAGLVRNILVDHYRKKSRHKRGRFSPHVTLDRVSEMVSDDATSHIDWLSLHELLDKLQQLDHISARIVELRYFGGLSVEETANALEISVSTAVRNWRFARSWLQRQLRPPQPQ